MIKRINPYKKYLLLKKALPKLACRYSFLRFTSNWPKMINPAQKVKRKIHQVQCKSL